jgi:hypothetical protein
LFFPLVNLDRQKSLFEIPLKYLERRDRDISPGTRKEVAILDEILKVFLHPPPPSEREDFDGIVEFTIPKATVLSIHKMRL